MRAWLEKLLFEQYWAIAYRVCEYGAPLSCDTQTHTYTALAAPRGHWAADPILFEHGGRLYLFCELARKYHNRAVIGVSEWDGTAFSTPRPVLALSCHTSYPAVFEHGGAVYMIPETGARRTVELYRAVCFPDQWELASVLRTDFECADATPFSHLGETWLFLYEPNVPGAGNKLYIAPLDMDTLELGPLECVETYLAKLGRPAGPLLETQQGLVRPTQHGVRRYGERVVYKQIAFENGYSECDIATLSPGSVRVPGAGQLLGVHTVARLGGVEAVDVFYRKFAPQRALAALFARLARRNGGEA